jgi:CheY-like chemotaxis protein
VNTSDPASVQEMHEKIVRLEETVHRREAFFGRLAQELRAPIVPLRNSVSVLKLTTNDPRSLRALQLMERQLTRLARMVDELVRGGTDGSGKWSAGSQPEPGAAVTSETESAAAICDDLPRILIVDDNRDAAESLGLLLQMLGASVLVADDGPSAIRAVGAFRPGVVMLDLGMPGMDGFEVASRIREREDWNGITLIALTGWGQESDRKFIEAAGFAHHVVKPAEIGALQTLLASLK